MAAEMFPEHTWIGTPELSGSIQLVCLPSSSRPLQEQIKLAHDSLRLDNRGTAVVNSFSHPGNDKRTAPSHK